MKPGANKIIEVLIVIFILPAFTIFILLELKDIKNDPVKPLANLQKDKISAADHSSYAILQQDFESPHDVTAACLSCHAKRGEEIMQTAHWKWERDTEIPGRGEVTIGKKNLINNFCTGAAGNNGSCMRCHIGYGWKDKSFDFDDPNNIDCLVCHDQTQTYYKQSGQAGYPATEETANESYFVPDYNYVATSVGLPKRNNCGICHYYGGGGNNVKHGDLEEVLNYCTEDVDVHMAVDGADMQCVDCHETENHNIKGKLYSVSAANTNRITCVQCHTDEPHNNRIYDQHTEKIACQTCHIPHYAKGNATKLWWDWSTAGELKEDGSSITENDADGNHNYLSIKGTFVWNDNVEPEYYWFNGTADHYLIDDTVSQEPVNINTLYGSYADSMAKIWPVKVHRGRQPYDPVNKTLISMKLWADSVGKGAFWKDFDWQKGAVLGMEYNNREFSGEIDFIRSDAYWPINHMVAPKEQTLSCAECHSRDGRLENLNDFYLPGKTYNAYIDGFGIAMIILAALGVTSHGIGRAYYRRNNKRS